MRKNLSYTIVFLAGLLLSCNDKTIEKNWFNPPTWIHGEWEANDTSISIYTKFTVDDVIFGNNQSSAISYKDSFNQLPDQQWGDIHVEEDITSDHYWVDMFWPTDQTHYFDKIDNQTLKYSGPLHHSGEIELKRK